MLAVFAFAADRTPHLPPRSRLHARRPPHTRPHHERQTGPPFRVAHQSSLKGHLLVFAGAACISFAGFFVKDAPIDGSMVAFYRLLFGSVTLFLVAALRRERLAPPSKAAQVTALAGLLFCCDLLTWHRSIIFLGPGIATILANFQVFLLAIYGVVFLKDRLSWAQRIAMPLAIFGLVLLLGLHTGEMPTHIAKGVGLCLLSAFFYSAYILTLRQSQSTVTKLGPVTNMAWVSIFACAGVGVFCLATGVSFTLPDTRTVVTLAVLGVLCQSLGWLLLSMGLPFLTPFRAGLIMLVQPALAFLWDMLIYGTATGIINIFGAVLAIAAIGMGILSGQKPSEKSGAEEPPVLQVSLHPAGESGRFTRVPERGDE